MDDGPRAKTVLVVDDHPVVALGIELALRAIRGLCIAGVINDPLDPKGAITALAPDALVLDLAFSGTVNFPLIRQSRALVPSAVIVVFSSLPARLYRQDSLDAGADAYLTKDHDIDDLIALLVSLLSKAPKAATVPQHIDSSPGPNHDVHSDGTRLTPKEAEIARLLSRGLSIAEIASRVGANQNTVSVHRDNMRRKFGCRNSSELVARLARLYVPGELDG